MFLKGVSILERQMLANYSPLTKRGLPPISRNNLSGTQPHPFIYTLSVAAFLGQQQSWMVVTKKNMFKPTMPKKFII